MLPGGPASGCSGGGRLGRRWQHPPHRQTKCGALGTHYRRNTHLPGGGASQRRPDAKFQKSSKEATASAAGRTGDTDQFKGKQSIETARDSSAGEAFAGGGGGGGCVDGRRPKAHLERCRFTQGGWQRTDGGGRFTTAPEAEPRQVRRQSQVACERESQNGTRGLGSENAHHTPPLQRPPAMDKTAEVDRLPRAPQGNPTKDHTYTGGQPCSRTADNRRRRVPSLPGTPRPPQTKGTIVGNTHTPRTMSPNPSGPATEASLLSVL